MPELLVYTDTILLARAYKTKHHFTIPRERLIKQETSLSHPPYHGGCVMSTRCSNDAKTLDINTLKYLEITYVPHLTYGSSDKQDQQPWLKTWTLTYLCLIMTVTAIKYLIATRSSDLTPPAIMGTSVNQMKKIQAQIKNGSTNPHKHTMLEAIPIIHISFI